MKRSFWLFGVVTGMVLAVNANVGWSAEPAAVKPVKADKKAAAAEKPAKPALKGVYGIMATELKLSDEQIAKISEKVQARDQAIKAWDAANAEKLAEAKKAQAAAEESKNADAIKAAKAKVADLNKDRAKISDAAQQDIMSVLTADQAATWAAYNMHTGMMRRFSKAQLTDEQKAKCKELCMAQATQIGKLKPDDKKALDAIRAQVAKTIEETVLTAQQRELLNAQAAPAKDAKDAKPAKPAKPETKDAKN